MFLGYWLMCVHRAHKFPEISRNPNRVEPARLTFTLLLLRLSKDFSLHRTHTYSTLVTTIAIPKITSRVCVLFVSDFQHISLDYFCLLAVQNVPLRILSSSVRTLSALSGTSRFKRRKWFMQLECWCRYFWTIHLKNPYTNWGCSKIYFAKRKRQRVINSQHIIIGKCMRIKRPIVFFLWSSNQWRWFDVWWFELGCWFSCFGMSLKTILNHFLLI